MPSITEQLGLQVGGGIIGQVMGLAGDARQVNMNQKMLQQQIEANKQMSIFTQGLQKDMWDYTNYENQVKHIKEAGLNTAMLYAKGGAGGATVGNGGSNVASSGTSRGMEPVAMAGMALQAQQQLAQVKLMEAQAKNLDADTSEKLGWKRDNMTANTGNIKADTAIKEIEVTIKEVQKRIAEGTEEYTIGKAEKQWGILKNEMDIAARRNSLDMASYDTMLSQVKQNYANSVIDGALKKAQIINLDANTKATLQNAVSNYINATANAQNATTNRLNYNVNELNAETNHMNAITNKGYLTLEQFIKDLPDREKLYMQLGSQTIGQISNMLKPLGGGNTYITEGDTNIHKR